MCSFSFPLKSVLELHSACEHVEIQEDLLLHVIVVPLETDVMMNETL